MKRALGCVAVLAVLLGVLWSNPSARVAFLRHFWSSQNTTYFGVTPNVGLGDRLQGSPDTGRIAQRFPDDPWWQWQAAQVLPTQDDEAPTAFYDVSTRIPDAKYDELVARFPQVLWLRTEQLANALPAQTWNSGRQPRPTPTAPVVLPPGVSAPTFAAPAFAPPPAPTPTPYRVDESSRTTLVRGAELCASGQRLEPRNAFWNWMRAYCLFRLQRDNEALLELRQGVSKPFYNSHMGEERQAALQAKSRTKVLDWAEKVQSLYSSSYYDAEQRVRNVVALAVEAAEHRERAGQHAQALQIYDDLMQLLRKMRLAATNYNGVTTVSRSEAVVCESNHRRDQANASNRSSNGRLLSRTLTQTNGMPFVTSASLLAQYAAGHNRRDIAQRVVAEDNLAFRQASVARSSLRNSYGLTDDEMVSLLSWEWMGGTVAWQVCGLLGLWLLTMLGLGVRQVLSLVRRQRTPVAATSTSLPASPSLAPNTVARPLSWLVLALAALVPLGFSVALIAVLLNIGLVKAAIYQYGANAQSSMVTLSVASILLVTGASLLAFSIGLWGVNRALAPAQPGGWLSLVLRKGKAQPAKKSLDQLGLMTMPEQAESSWLPLSRDTMRQVCAPFNWTLSLAMPISWVALLVLGGKQTLLVPLAYLPGMTMPLIAMEAPGLGLSLLLTFLVMVRWSVGIIARSRAQIPLVQTANGAPLSGTQNGPSQIASPPPSHLASTGGVLPTSSGAQASSPAPTTRRGLFWRPRRGLGADALRGARDAVGVALVTSFALYVALVWVVLPLRARTNAYADLCFQVGELRAVQQINGAQAQSATSTTAVRARR